MKKSNIYKILLAGLVLLIVGIAAYYSYQERGAIDYAAHLDDVALTVDGQDLTLRDMTFYVLYEERQIEEQAIIYNSDSTKDYWNLHVDGIFISVDARKTAAGMAAHDTIFYNEAMEMGLALTEEEEAYLANEITDFWEDLYDIQLERLPVDEETINESIRRMALAQKYQVFIASENDRLYHEYDWDGYDYELLVEESHDIEINKSIWNRVQMGEVTLHHDSVSYINGLSDEERQEIKDKKK